MRLWNMVQPVDVYVRYDEDIVNKKPYFNNQTC